MYSRIDILGAPFAFGVPHSGPDFGPAAFRETDAYTRLTDTLGSSFTDCDVHLDEVRNSAAADVSTACFAVAETVAESRNGDALPIVIGGDHSVSLGSLHGASRSGSLGVLWIDAHADFNTFETSPSGDIHGMPLAGAVGDIDGHPAWEVSNLSESNISILGVRSVDYPEERQRIAESPLSTFDASAIEQRGFATVLENAIDCATDGVDALHVSIDIDAFDPSVAPGVSTPVRGGLSAREGFALVETLGSHPAVREKLVSLDFVELNPLQDTENQTAEFAAELVERFLHGPPVPNRESE